MYKGTVHTRQISKRLRLQKSTKEIYTHSGLSFFPDHFQFNTPVLLVSSDVLSYYSTVLLCKQFSYVVCSSELEKVDGETQQLLEKMGDGIVYFRDEFAEETSGLGLAGVLRYLRTGFPEGSFDILDLHTLSKYLERWDLGDIIFSVEDDDVINLLSQGKLTKDMLGRKDHTADPVFPPFLDSLEAHYRSGRVSKGTLMISPLSNQEGEIVERDRRTRISGMSINRCMHGDEVYVEEGKVVGISKRKNRVVVGTLFRIETGQGYNIGYVRPVDRKLPDVRVLTRLGQKSHMRKVVLDIIEWECWSHLPRGVIFRVLGQTGNYEDEIEAIMEHFCIGYFREKWIDVCSHRRAELGLPADPCDGNDKTARGLLFNDSEFSVERAIQDAALGKRRDLRHLDICSIDPKGCTDIDDALHCTHHGEYIEVGVHIADVSYYVTPGSVLDMEARNRSTTVYFPDRRVDMLPPFISESLCSLVENRDRAAFSCIWRFDRDFNVVSTEFCRSLIRSRAALSYEEAYRMTLDLHSTSSLRQSIVLLLDMATTLRSRRFDAGALELNTQEIYIENKDVKVRESVPTHYLVEEFMLLANISVAEFILGHNPEYSLLRRHPLPSAVGLDMIDCSTSKALNESLSKLDRDQSTVIKRIVTRSMQQALYFSSGESTDYYHYGLAVPVYTHFTSPIRRYPDIVVHRTLSYILEDRTDEIDGLAEYVNRRACSFMNFRHRNSQAASRMANELCLMTAIDDGPMDALVVSIKDNGMVVFIRKYGIEGFVRVPEAVTSQYRLFDAIKVVVDKSIERYCLDRTMKITIAE